MQLAEGYGAALADVLGAVFADPELGLDDEQRAALPTVLRRHLFALDAQGDRLAALRRAS